MSESKNNKTPKPFLKRGTRQYLSNATVRSLNQKPKIVEFGQSNQQESIFNRPAPISNHQEQQIKIQIKAKDRPKSINKPQARTANANVPPKSKPQKAVNQQINQTQNQKKKPAQLEDYLSGVPAITRKDAARSSLGKQFNQVKQKTVSKPLVTMANLLKRQDQECLYDDDQNSSNEEKSQIINKNTVFKTALNTQNKNNYRQVQPKSVEQPADVCFNSDSDQEQKPILANNKAQKAAYSQAKRANSNQWQQDENDKNTVEDQRGPSKLLQKYYKKQVLADSVTKVNTNANKKITVADIPPEVKAQLQAAFIDAKTAEIQKKFADLQSLISKKKKEQEKYEQQNKRLAKQRQQFAKQMQQKQKEFQQKVKNESSKLTRQKRYMKDQQTTGKADWKVKNELEELKVKLQQSQNQKKKMKAELTREIDRLRKKLEEQIAEKESLKGQIRCIQMQKIQTKFKEQPKAADQIIPKISYWTDAPKKSYVLNFFDENFTLISLDPSYYSFQNLEYYKYYLTIKDDECELLSEQKDSSGSKITRKYKNGKQEEEYVSKVLKQNFPPPFKLTIVHHLNGDIKIILPEGIIIYYDSKRQITQIRVNPQKIIYNFHRDRQIEMKFTSRRQVIHQSMKQNVLIRRINQDEQKFIKNEKGQIIRL